MLLTLPLVAGLFAVGATTLPTAPASLHARTRIAMLVGGALVVLIVTENARALHGIAATGTVQELPWLVHWLVRLVAPAGVARVG